LGKHNYSIYSNQTILKSVVLEGIKELTPDLTQNWSEERYDAALVCLNHNRHTSGTPFYINGIRQEQIRFEWTGKLTDKLTRTWRDIQEATDN